MENQKMLSVSIEKEFDVMKKEYSNSIYLRVYTSLFKSGIVKDLKPTNFTVLLAISSFMDSEGHCFPTQRQLSEITGISLPTINKAVKELLEYEVNGKALIVREFKQNGKFKNSYYTVNPISQIAIFDGVVKDIDTDVVKETLVSTVKETSSDTLKEVALNNNQETISNNNNSLVFKNSKEVAIYFADKYREQYGVNYNIIFHKDLPLIKSKLLGTFTDEQLVTMIDATISEYDKRWKNQNFPRPTISAMVSWIGQKALAIAEDSMKEFEEIQELTAESGSDNADVMKKFGIK